MLSTLFLPYKNITFGFSNRTDGSMNRHVEKEKRARYFKSIGIDPMRVVTADLVHGAVVARVSDESAGIMIAGTDALITNTKNLFLSATAADCFLLYFYDPISNAIGIAHAGWRGLIGGVIENTITELTQAFGTRPQNLLVFIAPGIRKCHFEISAQDREKFQSYQGCILERDGKIFVDLPSIAQEKLENTGVPQKHREDSGICTYCEKDTYFSHRRDQSDPIEVMAGHIGFSL